MKWIVAFDLEHAHCAPAVVARWMGDSASLIAVHVIDKRRTVFASQDECEQLERGARKALDLAILQAELPPARTEAVVVWGSDVAEALRSLALEQNVDGIIVARRTSVSESKIVYLGRTARRLLRALPVPIVVTPPELAMQGIGRGPVLLAGDGHQDARAARTFASNVGSATGRVVELVHVFPNRFKATISGALPQYMAGMYERYREQQVENLGRWMSAYNLAGLRRHETTGPVFHRILEVAGDQQASMVVCASRQLSVADRLFNSSVGSHLAARAPVPIAVVPSPE